MDAATLTARFIEARDRLARHPQLVGDRLLRAVFEDIIIDAPVVVTTDEALAELRAELLAMTDHPNDSYSQEFHRGWAACVNLWVLPALNIALGRPEDDRGVARS